MSDCSVLRSSCVTTRQGPRSLNAGEGAGVGCSSGAGYKQQHMQGVGQQSVVWP
jgi:hypothetical protein